MAMTLAEVEALLRVVQRRQRITNRRVHTLIALLCRTPQHFLPQPIYRFLMAETARFLTRRGLPADTFDTWVHADDWLDLDPFDDEVDP